MSSPWVVQKKKKNHHPNPSVTLTQKLTAAKFEINLKPRSSRLIQSCEVQSCKIKVAKFESCEVLKPRSSSSSKPQSSKAAKFKVVKFEF